LIERPFLRRLYSTFAPGLPGLGLLLLRVVAGIAAIVHDLMKLEAGLPIGGVILKVLSIAAGSLLLAGLWTPFSGSLVAMLGLWNLITTHPADPWVTILLVTIGAALALLGPGAWSVDARLFGWKRIDLGNRRS
jgi:putative oxidoreductase